MNEIIGLSAFELVKKIKLKELSVLEITEAYIKQITLFNPIINALNQFKPEELILQAKQADKLTFSSKPLPLLHGLPLSIKDAFHVKGFFPSKGCPGLFGQQSSFDARVISRLRKAGAIIFGLTNTSELLLSYESDNLLYGRTNNPYDLKRTAGGSSGGQAALIASRCIPAGLGNDAGGSIRQPAHYCGISAHKPTHGLVPLTGIFPNHNIGLGAQILSIGPMAREVQDLRLILSVIAGSDAQDPNAISVPYYNKSPEIKKLRVAFFLENPMEESPCNNTVNVLSHMIKKLEPCVHSITNIFPQELKKAARLHLDTFMYGGDGGLSIQNALKRMGQKEITILTKKFLELAKNSRFSVSEFRARLVELDDFRIKMNMFMQDFDILLSPVTASAARLHGETFKYREDIGYLLPYNLTGWPVTVVPCGLSADNLPIGIQIAAKKWKDGVCLSVAQKIQELAPRFLPKNYFDSH